MTITRPCECPGSGPRPPSRADGLTPTELLVVVLVLIVALAIAVPVLLNR